MWSDESVLVSVVELIHDLGCRQKFLKPLSRSVGLNIMVNVGEHRNCFDVPAKCDHHYHPFSYAHITVSLR